MKYPDNRDAFIPSMRQPVSPSIEYVREHGCIRVANTARKHALVECAFDGAVGFYNCTLTADGKIGDFCKRKNSQLRFVQEETVQPNVVVNEGAPDGTSEFPQGLNKVHEDTWPTMPPEAAARGNYFVEVDSSRKVADSKLKDFVWDALPTSVAEESPPHPTMTKAEIAAALKLAAENIRKANLTCLPEAMLQAHVDACIRAEYAQLESQGRQLLAIGFAMDQLTIAEWPQGSLVIPKSWLPCTYGVAIKKFILMTRGSAGAPEGAPAFPPQRDSCPGCLCRTCSKAAAVYLDQCQDCRNKSTREEDKAFLKPPTKPPHLDFYA